MALRGAAAGLDLGTGRRGGDRLGGAHLSRFRGRGMEYTESRRYLAGDDVRHMDWRVTARTGRTHTKIFQEERDRPLIAVVHLSASMFFGTRRAFKSAVATQAAALLAWAALRHGDRVGALVSAPNGHAALRPAAGLRGVLTLISRLAALSRPPEDPTVATAPLADSLARARRVARPGSLLVVLSDFYDLDDDAERHLARLRGHNDLLACHVQDPLETAAPPPGRYPISDGGAQLVVDTASRDVTRAYRRHFEARAERLADLCARLDVGLLALSTAGDTEQTLRHALGGARRSTGVDGSLGH
jgi:uncharacterized protein (DUF58 family)